MDGDLVGEAVNDLLFHVEGFAEAGGAGESEGLDVAFLFGGKSGEEGRAGVCERRWCFDDCVVEFSFTLLQHYSELLRGKTSLPPSVPPSFLPSLPAPPSTTQSPLPRPT